MSPGQRPSPADPGKAGCSTAPPLAAATADHPAQKGHPPEPLNQTPSHTSLSPLPPGMIRSRTAASRAPAVPLRGRCAPHDPPARSQNPAAIRAQGADPGIPRPSDHDRETPEIERLRSAVPLKAWRHRFCDSGQYGLSLLRPRPARGRAVPCPLFLLPGAAGVPGVQGGPPGPSPAGRCAAPWRPGWRPRTLSGRSKDSGGAAAAFAGPRSGARRGHAASFPARKRS